MDMRFFDFGFSLMSVIIPIIFAVCFIFILVQMIRGVGTWHHNNQSPELRVAAKVVAKRTNVWHSHHADNMAITTTDTEYYVTFEVESGDRMEFYVSGQEYGLLVEGDVGTVSFKGTRYLGFERNY